MNAFQSASALEERRELRWIFLVVVAVVTTFVSLRTRAADALFDSGGLDAQILYRMTVWFVLGCIGLKFIHNGRADLRLVRSGPLLWYSLYVLMAIISTLWAASFLLSFYFAVQLGVALVLVISLRRHYNKLPYFICAYVIVFWLLAAMSATPIGVFDWVRAIEAEYTLEWHSDDELWRFGDIFGHPSQLSIVAAMAAIQLAARINRDNWKWSLPIILWMIATTLMTVSRTAIFGLALGLVIVATVRGWILYFVVAVGLAVPLLLVSTNLGERAERYFMRGQSSAEFASLSGRDNIYKEALERADEALPWGVGFKSSRKKVFGGAPNEAAIAHAHNMFLESLVNMGIVGGVLSIVILVMATVRTWQIIVRSPRRNPKAIQWWEVCAILMPLLAFSVMDLGFASEVTPVLFMYLVFFARVETEWLDEPPLTTDELPVAVEAMERFRAPRMLRPIDSF